MTSIRVSDVHLVLAVPNEQQRMRDDIKLGEEQNATDEKERPRDKSVIEGKLIRNNQDNLIGTVIKVLDANPEIPVHKMQRHHSIHHIGGIENAERDLIRERLNLTYKPETKQLRGAEGKKDALLGRVEGSKAKYKRSVSLSNLSPHEHYIHIKRNLKDKLGQLQKIRNCPGHPIAVPKYGLTQRRYGRIGPRNTVESLATTTVPEFIDKYGRVMYDKVYKINVAPDGFVVYTPPAKWLMCNHYYLVHGPANDIESKDTEKGQWHLFADYDGVIENNPLVRDFNSANGCTLANFEAVVRFMQLQHSPGTQYCKGGDGTWYKVYLHETWGFVFERLSSKPSLIGPGTDYHGVPIYPSTKE
jgi:hypothetical protein